jgi:C-terminal processing protease CtpA/Prc
VRALKTEGQAAKSGVKTHDLLLTCCGTDVSKASVSDVHALIRAVPEGESIQLSLLRSE